jgi:carbamoyl-phosphate synthase large subunit
MTIIKILFLGAGKRLSLLEQFIEASKLEGVNLRLYAAEISNKVPISQVATILESPTFSNPEFTEWLLDFVRSERINIVIPNMDAATVSLSLIKDELQSLGVWAVVSAHDLCLIMEDKIYANAWFIDHHLPVPGLTNWPRIIKPRKGFGGKSQFLVGNEYERAKILKNIDFFEFIEQEYIVGPEYSVDAYVSRTGKFISAMPRLRIRVLDGEVDESLSIQKPEIEKLSKEIIECVKGWEGPLTLQFIESDTGPILIEINPRFGGGVTHSIYCGLHMPQWILKEWLGRNIPDCPAWKAGSLMTRCRRDIFL